MVMRDFQILMSLRYVESTKEFQNIENSIDHWLIGAKGDMTKQFNTANTST